MGSDADIQPLRFEHGALHVLDQRALPGEERWIACETPEQVADCIRTLAVRGAPAIGVAAAYGLALADDREAAGALLRATRPTAVNLAWAIERSLAATDPLATRARAARRAGARPTGGWPSSAPSASGTGDRALTHCNAGALATAGYGTARAACCARPGSGAASQASGSTRRGRCSRARA